MAVIKTFGSHLYNQEESVNSQIDEMMTGSEMLERIRKMPGTFMVPRDGHERKRAIALRLGLDHLGGYQSELSPQQLEELNTYVALVDSLVETGYLLVHKVDSYLLGRGGISPFDVFGYDVTYVVLAPEPHPNDPVDSIDSTEDLLELIKEEGRFVYTTRFERGAAGFASSIAHYSGEDDSQTERLLDFVNELREAGRVTVESESFEGTHLASKGERIDNLPSALHIVQAV